MINAVNNISFKSIIVPQKGMSETQKKVVADIRTKLDDVAKEKTFIILSSKNDSLELFEIDETKRKNNSVHSDFTYIGEYDESHPFKMKDYISACKCKSRQWMESIALVTVLLGSIIAYGLFFHRKNSSRPIEKVVTLQKDSLQVVRDSLKIFK